MNGFISALEDRQIRDHGIPVTFTESAGILFTVFEKITGTQDYIKTFLCPMSCHSCFRFFLLCKGKMLKKLILRILAFRMKQDTFNRDGLFLAVVEPRKPENTTFVDNRRISSEVSCKCLLHSAES